MTFHFVSGMDMYVWRFPLVAFAGIVTTAALLVVLHAALLVRRHARSATYRGLLLGCAAVSVIASPVLVQVLIEPRLRAARSDGLYVDPSPFAFWSPGGFALAILLAAMALFPASSSRSPQRWRAGFAAVMLLAGALNVVNWCSPGWCERLGFPLSYWRWSDVQLAINGNDPVGPNYMMLSVNCIVFLIPAFGASLLYRRPSMAV